MKNLGEIRGDALRKLFQEYENSASYFCDKIDIDPQLISGKQVEEYISNLKECANKWKIRTLEAEAEIKIRNEELWDY